MSDFMRCQRLDSGWVAKGMNLIPDRVWGLLLRKSKFYLVPELKREIDIQLRSLFWAETIFHFLYGENDFRRFNPPKTSKLFVTYHFPPDKYRQYFTKPPNLGRVNAIIVVGSNQIDYFAKWVSKERIVFIPHGIDTEYYKPADNEVRNDKVLFVGSHLRDFDVLKGVIERIEKLSVNLSFTIVTLKENWKVFRDLKNMELLTDVTEHELLRLYQNHALCFLPLIDGTANNTLLEAAASGLPIITTDVGGVRDYLDDRTAILLRSKKIEEVASIVVDVVNDEGKRRELSVNAREKILSYDWKIVAETMKKAYEVY
ncbi:MAG: glycosyltransferase family 4 protein [Syntrophaceae bacterium]|nr:glycosyltransferase family 4 protein [Syntrophaceae bacterium]